MQDSQSKLNAIYPRRGLIIFALIMLFNPNINIIDFLPDFIGFYILAKSLMPLSNAVPYMEEARIGFRRAMWITLLKIPALIIMTMIRSKNTLDNDIIVLFSFVFAVVEIIALIPAVKNLFSGLVYLAERGNIPAVLQEEGLSSTDSVRSFTQLFIVAKSLFFFLPETVKLTRTLEIGSNTVIATGSRYYSWFLLIALVLGFIVGTVWLVRTVRYTRRVLGESLNSAIDLLVGGDGAKEYNKEYNRKKKNTGYLFFTVGAIFSFNITFSDLRDINILPRFIMAVFLLFGIFTLAKYMNITDKPLCRRTLIFSGIYTLSATAFYIVSVVFLNQYTYSDLYKSLNPEAGKMYLLLEIFAVIEFLVFLVFLYFLRSFLLRYISTNLSLRFSDGENTEASKKRKHEFTNKVNALVILMALSMLAKLLDVFFHGSIQAIEASSDVAHSSIIYAPAVPWFNIVVVLLSVLYAFYSFYFFGLLREEGENGFSAD